MGIADGVGLTEPVVHRLVVLLLLHGMPVNCRGLEWLKIAARLSDLLMIRLVRAVANPLVIVDKMIAMIVVDGKYFDIGHIHWQGVRLVQIVDELTATSGWLVICCHRCRCRVRSMRFMIWVIVVIGMDIVVVIVVVGGLACDGCVGGAPNLLGARTI